MSEQNTYPTARQRIQSLAAATRSSSGVFVNSSEPDSLSRLWSNESPRPEVIEEVSEPASPDTLTSSQHSSQSSILSEMFHKYNTVEQDAKDQGNDACIDSKGVQPAVVGQGIISQPCEDTTFLLSRTAYRSSNDRAYGTAGDLENQKAGWKTSTTKSQLGLMHTCESSSRIFRIITNPKLWDKRALWIYCVCIPAGYIPPVMLGLLLNILDALSYGACCS